MNDKSKGNKNYLKEKLMPEKENCYHQWQCVKCGEFTQRPTPTKLTIKPDKQYKVRENLVEETFYNGFQFYRDMGKYKGQWLTPTGKAIGTEHWTVKENIYYWTADMFCEERDKPEEETYEYGDKLIINGNKYILAYTEHNCVMLINCDSGTRWDKSFPIKSGYKITKAELKAHLGAFDWKKVE